MIMRRSSISFKARAFTCFPMKCTGSWRSGKKLHWDNVKGVVTNVDNPAEIVSKEYRKGWELPC